jgi:hypothetical protein
MSQSKIEALVELWQRREEILERRIVEWAGINLSPALSNDLIEVVRNLATAGDVRNDLTALVASLTDDQLQK